MANLFNPHFVYPIMKTMKTITALLFIGLTAFAQSASTFEVKELDPETVRELTVTQSKLDTDLAALKALQDVVAEDTAKRDKITSSVKSLYREFESQCQWSSGSTYTPRHFRQVEIRGKYVLITEGDRVCGTSAVLTGPITYANQ